MTKTLGRKKIDRFLPNAIQLWTMYHNSNCYIVVQRLQNGEKGYLLKIT